MARQIFDLVYRGEKELKGSVVAEVLLFNLSKQFELKIERTVWKRIDSSKEVPITTWYQVGFNSII
jgi:hypothetical protein